MHCTRLRIAALAAVIAAAAAPPAAGAAAATGGERPAVVVGDLTLEAPSGYEGLLRDLATRAAVDLPRLEADLGVRAKGPFRIVLIPGGPSRDPEIAALDRAAPPWAAGFVILSRRTGGIRMARANHYPFSDLGSVLTHEAAHVLLFDAAGEGLPRWFSEGVAMGEERSWGLRDVFVYSSSLLVGALPHLSEMERAFEMSESAARTAYAGSFDFISWARRRHGASVVREVLRAAATRPFPEAWLSATGEPLGDSESAWRRSSLLLYRWVPALTGTTAVWAIITLLALLAAARRRARSQAIRARWDAERGESDDLPM